MLDPKDTAPNAVIDAIANDPALDADQKAALLAIYRSFVAGDTDS